MDPWLPGAARHLLTFIAVCHVCEGPLGSTRRDGSEQLQCHLKGGTSQIDEAGLADRLRRAGAARLPGPPGRHRAAPRLALDDGELAGVRDALAEARAELDELRDAVGAGTLSVASLARAEPGVLRRVGALELRERELATPPVLAGIITPGRDVKRRWKAAPIAAKREVARLLLSPAILGEVQGHPLTREGAPRPGRAARHLPPRRR